MKTKKHWKKVIEVEASGKPNWYGGAYTLAFVYSNKGNFLVKGYIKEVQEYLDKLKTKGYKYIVNFTLWSHIGWDNKSVHRDIWQTSKDKVWINEPNSIRKKWSIYRYENNKKVGELRFKRLPKKWIPEFNEIL